MSTTARLDGTTVGDTGAHRRQPVVEPTFRDSPPTYVAALDGLRGVAVAGVMVYHHDKLSGGFGAARGGFLGVSAFFTLSGYLITSLMLNESERTGTIRLGSFWARRVRRLMPEAVVVLVATVAGARLWLTGDHFVGLRGDVLGALANVANWSLLLGGTSYGETNGAWSPVLHFWSLAIEEQFYLAWPIVVAGALRWGSVRTVRAAALLLVAGSATFSTVVNLAGGSIDQLYLSTTTRMGEIGIGAVFATVLPLARSRHAGGRRSTGATAVTAASIAGILAAWTSVEQQSRWLYPTGLLVHAVATCVLIAAACRPGWIQHLLGARLPGVIGRLSYSLYLVHWPIYLIVDERRTGIDGLTLFGLRLAASVAAASISYGVIGQPTRRRRIVSGPTAGVVVAVAIVGAAASGWLLTADPPACRVTYCNVSSGAGGLTTATAVPSSSSGARKTTTQPEPSRLSPPSASVSSSPAGERPSPRGREGGSAATATPGEPVDLERETALLVGDSGMFGEAPAIGAALQQLGYAVIDNSYPGVGVADGSVDWRTIWGGILDQNRVTLVIAMMGGWDVEFRREHGAEAYAAVLDDVAELLTARGATVLWISVLPGGDAHGFEINADLEALAWRFSASVYFYDASATVRDEQGAYPRYIAGELFRTSDGWHLCQAGAASLARGVLQELGRLGHLGAMPDAAWEAGQWTTDSRYGDCETASG